LRMHSNECPFHERLPSPVFPGVADCTTSSYRLPPRSGTRTICRRNDRSGQQKSPPTARCSLRSETISSLRLRHAEGCSGGIASFDFQSGGQYTEGWHSVSGDNLDFRGSCRG
jgi:hypothetical protein